MNWLILFMAQFKYQATQLPIDVFMVTDLWEAILEHAFMEAGMGISLIV